MIIGSDGLELIKHFEGFFECPYRCPAGVSTIGYGTTVYPDGRKVTLADGNVSRETAAGYLQHDLRACENVIDNVVDALLEQHHFDALVSFSYNVGVSAFETSTLLKLLNLGDYVGAADQFLRWNKGGGRVLPGLVRRRAAERALFLGQNWREFLA